MTPTTNDVEPTTSATEVLRRMLDERGVEHEGGKRSVRWRDRNGVMMQAFPLANGELGMGVWSCTPEQAIAATLGQESDDAAMVKLHDQMNAAMLEYEMAQGIEKRDGDEAIVVPWVAKIHALLEEAAALGSCNCSNSERTDAPSLPYWWTHDGTLHVELPKLPESISVRLPDQRDREVRSARTWQYTLGNGGVGRTNDGLADLQAKNAKLRKMLASTISNYVDGYMDDTSARYPCDLCDESSKQQCDYQHDRQCPFYKQLRELGVEVDA